MPASTPAASRETNGLLRRSDRLVGGVDRDEPADQLRARLHRLRCGPRRRRRAGWPGGPTRWRGRARRRVRRRAPPGSSPGLLTLPRARTRRRRSATSSAPVPGADAPRPEPGPASPPRRPGSTRPAPSARSSRLGEVVRHLGRATRGRRSPPRARRRAPRAAGHALRAAGRRTRRRAAGRGRRSSPAPSGTSSPSATATRRASSTSSSASPTTWRSSRSGTGCVTTAAHAPPSAHRSGSPSSLPTSRSASARGSPSSTPPLGSHARRQRLHVVGVPPRATEHLGGDLRVECASVQPRQVLLDLRRLERREVEALHRRQPTQLAEQPADPGTRRQSVGPDGRHHDQSLRGHPAEQEPQEVRRGRVHPLQILDRDDDRTADASEVREQRRHRVEELESSRLVGRGVARRRPGRSGRPRPGSGRAPRRPRDPSFATAWTARARSIIARYGKPGSPRSTHCARTTSASGRRQVVQHRADQPGLPHSRLARRPGRHRGSSVGRPRQGGPQDGRAPARDRRAARRAGTPPRRNCRTCQSPGGM